MVYTPYPSSAFIKKAFEGGVAIKPKNYDEIKDKTKHVDNIRYSSSFTSNELDVISPQVGPLPVILWVHGGAFAAGDKSDITEYAVQIAAHGYHVVNINYALAPKDKYPTPLLQLHDAYQWILEHAGDYQFDPTKIIIAGDSAGAQIVSQYALVQTNEDYANKIQIKPVISKETIVFDGNELPHEYQFMMNTLEAEETYKPTIQFLKEVTN